MGEVCHFEPGGSISRGSVASAFSYDTNRPRGLLGQAIGEAAGDVGDPALLEAHDLVQPCATECCEKNARRSSMSRVHFETDEAGRFEIVNGGLQSLAGNVQDASELGDGERDGQLFHLLEQANARAREAGRDEHRIASGGEPVRGVQNLGDEFSVGLHLWTGDCAGVSRGHTGGYPGSVLTGACQSTGNRLKCDVQMRF
jgi:hypothetical protein